MARRRTKPKSEATVVAKKLLAISVSRAESDLELAKEQAALARRIMLKFNIRFDWSLRRFYCHGCKKLIVPGVNARVRLGKNGSKVLRITCTECGHVNRKIIGETNEARLA